MAKHFSVLKRAIHKKFSKRRSVSQGTKLWLPPVTHRIPNNASSRFLDVFICLFFAFIAFVYVRNIVLSPGLPAVFDWSVPPDRSQLIYSFEEASYAWRYLGVFTGSSASPLWTSTTVWNAIGYIAAQLGLDGITYAKAALVIVIFAGGVSSFFLLRCLGFSRMASLLGGTLYISAPIYFNWLTMQGFAGITVVYSFLPASIAFFLKATSDGKHWLRYSILATLFMINTYPVISAALAMMILIPYSITTIIRSRRKDVAFIMLRILVVMIFLFICLQSFWIVPMFAMGEPTTFLTEQRALGQLSWNYRFVDVFKLWGHYVDAYEGIAGSIGLPNPIGLLVPIIAVSALIIGFKVRWASVFFTGIATVGIFLIGTPQGVALIQSNFLMLGVFADRAKLFFLISLSYSVLIADLIDKVKTKTPKRLAIALMMSLTLLISTIAAPFMLGSLGNQFIENRSFPQAYDSVLEWLRQREGDFKVLWLPTGSNFVTEATYTKSWTVDFYGIYSPKPGIVYDISHRHVFVPQFWLTNLFYESSAEQMQLPKILGLFNVKYLIYRPASYITNWGTRLDSPAWKRNTSDIGEALEKQTNLEKIINYSDAQVYLNKENLPHIYAVPTIGIVSGDLASIERLASYSNSTFADLGLIFASQLPDANTFERASTVFVQDNDFFDLLLPFLNDTVVLDPGEFTNSPHDTSSGEWANLHQWYWVFDAQEGLENSATARGDNAVMEIPIHISKAQSYQIWVKTALGSNQSAITFNISNKTWSTQSAITSYSTVESGFRWIQLTEKFANESIQLAEGSYILSIVSPRQGNVLARIVIASSSDIDRATLKSREYLSDRSIDLISKMYDKEKKYTTTTLVPVDGSYEFYLRAPADANPRLKINIDSSQNIKIAIDGNGIEEVRESVPKSFQWYKAGEIYLQQGYYNTTLESIHPIGADLLRLSLSHQKVENPAPELKFEKISPTQYTVHVNASQPFFLIFSESYNPQWKAYFGDVNWFETFWGKHIGGDKHFLVNSYANAWYIEKTGKYDITLYFLPQSLLYIGVIVSLLTLAFCLICLSQDGVKYFYFRYIRKNAHT